MKFNPRHIAWLALVVLALNACAGNQQSAIQTAIAETAAAQAFLQTSVAGTVAAMATPTSEATATPEATTTETATPTPNEFAPDPLPASHTGVNLTAGDCFDFDNGQVTAPNGSCDMWAVEGALIRPMNGASISGYVTMTAPSRNDCVAGQYEPGDLAIQTDLYMCFITNDGAVGFVVARSYLGSVPFSGFSFDYWTFD